MANAAAALVNATQAQPPQWPLQAQCNAVYGDPTGANGSYSPAWAAANLVHVPCPWVLLYEGQHVPFITIHRHVAPSLTRVLAAIWTAVGQSESAIETLHYNQFSGSFNFRPIRGGTHLSMHSYGVAIDWDAQENPQHSTAHLFQSNSLIVTAFKAENWTWGGDWSVTSIDAMHFQAARVS